MRTMLIAWILGLACAGGAQARCIAHSAALRTHLIELYTSEGCSSCPPADAWLRTVHAGVDVVPLEFHVDYWDSLGWQDRFADPRFTQRQRELATRSGSGIVYTPEVALDGRESRNWSGLAPRATQAAASALTLRVEGSGAHLQAQLDATPIAATGDWRAYFVVSEDDLSSAVRAGENRGALLRHDDTVRAFAGPLPLQAGGDTWTARTVFALPRDVVTAHAALTAFVQDGHNGTIAQVVRQPLQACLR